MSQRSYPVGETIISTNIYTKIGTNQPMTPVRVLARLLDPNGIETRPTVITKQPGICSVTFVPYLAGTWYLRWEATNDVQAVSMYKFQVEPSPFAT